MKRPALLFLLACSLLLALAACKAPSAAPGPSPAEATPSSPHLASASGFDYYLLNLSWSPEYCYSHPHAAECASKSTFVLHGLWPQNSDGTYPENCSSAPGPSNPQAFSDIYPDVSLLEHEWRTHGSCTGLSADDFFSAARTAYRSVTIPPELAGLTTQASMPPDGVLSLFTRSNPALTRASLALSCGNNYLTAVEVCLDKTLHPIPCGPIRSCRAGTVRIPPPG